MKWTWTYNYDHKLNTDGNVLQPHFAREAGYTISSPEATPLEAMLISAASVCAPEGMEKRTYFPEPEST